MIKCPSCLFFTPTDHLLVNSYLSCKVKGEALQCNYAVVFEMERHYIYGGKGPWDIFSMHAARKDTPAVYLFTTPPSANENVSIGNVKNNNNGGGCGGGGSGSGSGGTWELVKNSRVPVKDPDCGNKIVGFKKSFVYENESNPDQDGQWLMTEFTTLTPPKVQSSDYVVCKIEKRKGKQGGGRPIGKIEKIHKRKRKQGGEGEGGGRPIGEIKKIEERKRGEGGGRPIGKIKKIEERKGGEGEGEGGRRGFMWLLG